MGKTRTYLKQAKASFIEKKTENTHIRQNKEFNDDEVAK